MENPDTFFPDDPFESLIIEERLNRVLKEREAELLEILHVKDMQVAALLSKLNDGKEY